MLVLFCKKNEKRIQARRGKVGNTLVKGKGKLSYRVETAPFEGRIIASGFFTFCRVSFKFLLGISAPFLLSQLSQ